METTWRPSGGYGDDVGTTGTTWGGDHGDNGGPQVMETTWRPSGGYGDDVGMTGTTRG